MAPRRKTGQTRGGSSTQRFKAELNWRVTSQLYLRHQGGNGRSGAGAERGFEGAPDDRSGIRSRSSLHPPHAAPSARKQQKARFL